MSAPVISSDFETPAAVMALQWDAAAYAANSKVQEAWGRELIGQLGLRGDERVMDVGCGDGKITAQIAARLPRGTVTGVDVAPEMIEFARRQHPAGTFSNLKFAVMDARELKADGPVDLIFSNAALHWVDDHAAFLRRAAAVLKPGGRLVVSCGGRGNAHEVFLAMRPLMRRRQWREFFRGMTMPYFFHAPEKYRSWLARANFQIERLELAPQDTTYAGAAGFAKWLRFTWLPYVQRVPEELREEFIQAVTQRFMETHPPDAAGQVHVRMVRLELAAIKH